MQNALAQETELGTAVHAALDQFEAVDLPLDGAGTPRFDNGGAHGGLVLPKPGDEAAEIGRSSSLQPWRQPGGIALAQEVGEDMDILGGLLQLRRSDAERFGEGAILPRQRGRVACEPAGDAARRGDLGGRWSGRRTVPPSRAPAPDDIVAADEALSAQLAVKSGSAVLALLPARLDKGKMAVEPA